ncbi:MAG: hypothetical protein QXU99_02930 [Candidatus Bathyarchaeia archaeon]
MPIPTAIATYGRKLLSLTLIFNSLLTAFYAVGLLTGVYTAGWKLYPPYFLDANLLWLIIIAAIINVFPAAHIGKVKTGRLWFHHYVYGFIVLISSIASAAIFSSISLFALLTSNITDITANVSRFFFLGGITLIIDDSPDISHLIKTFLNHLKIRAYAARKFIYLLQILLGSFAVYTALAVLGSTIHNPADATLANSIFIGSLTASGLMSFWSVKNKIWLNLKNNQTE